MLRELLARLWPKDGGAKTSPTPPQFPMTYGPATDKAGAQFGDLFEPALRHFPCALRKGEPSFADHETRAAWRTARRAAMDRVLRAVAGSPARESLILRGSVVMKAWFGDAAREPGDLDWVVRPSTIAMTDPVAKSLLTGVIAEVLNKSSWAEDLAFLPDGVAMDDIWTYERAPGQRVVFPWRAPELPDGVTQCDFVFQEEMSTDPVETEIPLADGSTVSLWSASREQSLLWKLFWLETDGYPQGKDLYDATLLAESTALSPDLFRRTMVTHVGAPMRPLTADFPMQWSVDWANFRAEYPDVTGDVKSWQKRLTAALRPVFD